MRSQRQRTFVLGSSVTVLYFPLIVCSSVGGCTSFLVSDSVSCLLGVQCHSRRGCVRSALLLPDRSVSSCFSSDHSRVFPSGNYRQDGVRTGCIRCPSVCHVRILRRWFLGFRRTHHERDRLLPPTPGEGPTLVGLETCVPDNGRVSCVRERHLTRGYETETGTRSTNGIDTDT